MFVYLAGHLGHPGHPIGDIYNTNSPFIFFSILPFFLPPLYLLSFCLSFHFVFPLFHAGDDSARRGCRGKGESHPRKAKGKTSFRKMYIDVADNSAERPNQGGDGVATSFSTSSLFIFPSSLSLYSLSPSLFLLKDGGEPASIGTFCADEHPPLRLGRSSGR